MAMELRHLRYFVAIAEERSFTRAAERLWIAQPGVSSQTRPLEAELGVTLLERHSRGVDLTDAGALFLERARAVLAAVEAAASVGRDLRDGLAGPLLRGSASASPRRVAAAGLRDARAVPPFGRDARALRPRPRACRGHLRRGPRQHTVARPAR